MIVLSATFRIKPEAKGRFEAAATTMVRHTLPEAGCLRYAFHENPLESGQYLFFEEWETRSHLNAHFETEHFKHFVGEVPEMTAEPTRIRIYDVASYEDL